MTYQPTALITGGLGFIGSNLAHRLVADGWKVRVVDCLLPGHGGQTENLRGIAHQVECIVDRIEYAALHPEWFEDVDVVFHLAAQTGHMASMTDPLADMNSNLIGTLAVLDTVRSVCPQARVVYASTRQVYGRPQALPVNEEHPICPVDVNGIHKRAAEEYLRLYGEVYGLQSCTLRLSNTIGPRMRILDANQNFLGIWIRQILRGQSFEVWGGAQRRDMTDISDCVEAFVLAAQVADTSAQCLNLGAPKAHSLRTLADKLVTAFGRGYYSVRAFPADRKKIDIGDFVLDTGAAARVLGWTPKVSIDESFESIAQFYGEGVPSIVTFKDSA